jgi:hypothetical protein
MPSKLSSGLCVTSTFGIEPQRPFIGIKVPLLATRLPVEILMGRVVRCAVPRRTEEPENYKVVQQTAVMPIFQSY